MRRNCIFGSASSRPSLQHQESNCKNLNMPTPPKQVLRDILGTLDLATKEAVTPAPKVAHLPFQIFILFRTLAMACVNFTTTTPIGITGAFRPFLGRKTIPPLDPFRFGSFFHTCDCHGYAFSCKCLLDVSN